MPYLDWKVLLETARNNKNIDFVFYGPYANEFSFKINPHHQFKEELSKLSNTFFLGKVEANVIPFIFQKIDILLVSYQEKYHIDQSNSHKMMEYLGSGKVIVATKTQEYKSLANISLIAMTDRNQKFTSLFSAVAQNLKTWNGEKKQEQRRLFALNNTYEKQIARIEKLI